MNAETYRKIVSGRLWAALRESFYDVFAAHVEKRSGLHSLSGKEAVARYLVKRYGWPLVYCRTLNADDLQTLLFGEVDFLHLQADLQAIYDEASDMLERFEFPVAKAPECPPRRASVSRAKKKKA